MNGVVNKKAGQQFLTSKEMNIKDAADFGNKKLLEVKNHQITAGRKRKSQRNSTKVEKQLSQFHVAHMNCECNTRNQF